MLQQQKSLLRNISDTYLPNYLLSYLITYLHTYILTYISITPLPIFIPMTHYCPTFLFFQFPYTPPQANEPTKTLRILVNIQKESVRFVKAPDEARVGVSGARFWRLQYHHFNYTHHFSVQGLNSL